MKRSIAMIMLAVLAISSFSFIVNLANADTEIQGTWVRMRGVTTYWGNTTVFGFIGADVGRVNKNGTIHEWSRVHVIWSSERPINHTGPQPPPPPESFNCTFYAAKLIETAGIDLNVSEGTLDIAGFWNVSKITTSVNIIKNGNNILINITRTIDPVVTNATGVLHVFDTFTKFALDITGIDVLRGLCMTIIKHVEIKICDTNDDGKVDLFDLVKVAKRYGTKPGIWNYDHNVDFNFNDEIDIGDLTTVAANIDAQD